jgi:hypothetical protein
MPTLAELQDPAVMKQFIRDVFDPTVSDANWHPTHRHRDGREFVRVGETVDGLTGERLILCEDRRRASLAWPRDLFYGCGDDGRRVFEPLANEPELETDEQRLDHVRRTGLMRDAKDIELWMQSAPVPSREERERRVDRLLKSLRDTDI